MAEKQSDGFSVSLSSVSISVCMCAQAGAVKDYIKMMLEAEQLKFLVFAHHLTMLQACTEAAIEAKVTSSKVVVIHTREKKKNIQTKAFTHNSNYTGCIKNYPTMICG